MCSTSMWPHLVDISPTDSPLRCSAILRDALWSQASRPPGLDAESGHNGTSCFIQHDKTTDRISSVRSNTLRTSTTSTSSAKGHQNSLPTTKSGSTGMTANSVPPHMKVLLYREPESLQSLNELHVSDPFMTRTTSFSSCRIPSMKLETLFSNFTDDREQGVSYIAKDSTVDAPNARNKQNEPSKKSLCEGGLDWLHRVCHKSIVAMDAVTTKAITLDRRIPVLMDAVLTLLFDKHMETIQLENALVDLLGMHVVEIISPLLHRREQLIEEMDALQQHCIENDVFFSCEGTPSKRKEDSAPLYTFSNLTFTSTEEKKQGKIHKRKKLKKQASSQSKTLQDREFISFSVILEHFGYARPPTTFISREITLPADPFALEDFTSPLETKEISQKAEPANSFIHRFKGLGYEEVCVTPPPAFKPQKEALLPLEILPEWARVAFPSIKRFNAIQSTVLKAAFFDSKNMLICAPTGAGKTNVAMLTILQALSKYREESGEMQSAVDFKVVYIAPMKSLVSEIVEKFTHALSPLGVNVGEMTGDIHLTAKERDEIHIIVTVPEKWDILTRNSVKYRSESNKSVLSCVKCLIIDEIHLLNEDRGPILEAIARCGSISTCGTLYGLLFWSRISSYPLRAIFYWDMHPEFVQLRKHVYQSKSKEMKHLFDYGIGMHHAGMLRSDRSLTEKLFSKGCYTLKMFAWDAFFVFS
ncbi:hypothetical protein IE077_003057 [Cardiosporidium cionae]|uniref:Helicase ATP-binding domain-containing protein n=1 Tax=Cardiosporidium cionae TaxID=476202 RepID=A0ABQ7J995_9APIC|nr:hypothetical protein IE077_003057 [Cardiosporidium cionae]|eukprot:KAF8820542.1 hypothetical protein IE077_003057 [Cardiosporidium cionae]